MAAEKIKQIHSFLEALIEAEDAIKTAHSSLSLAMTNLNDMQKVVSNMRNELLDMGVAITEQLNNTEAEVDSD